MGVVRAPACERPCPPRAAALFCSLDAAPAPCRRSLAAGPDLPTPAGAGRGRLRAGPVSGGVLRLRRPDDRRAHCGEAEGSLGGCVGSGLRVSCPRSGAPTITSAAPPLLLQVVLLALLFWPLCWIPCVSPGGKGSRLPRRAERISLNPLHAAIRPARTQAPHDHLPPPAAARQVMQECYTKFQRPVYGHIAGGAPQAPAYGAPPPGYAPVV